MEKAVATHSSTLAWKIPWMEEPGGLQSMGSWRVGHDWATSLSLFTFTHWRRKWQPTPVFLPGESQGRRSLVGCRLWGRKELDTTEVTLQQQQQHSLCSLMYFVFSILPQWPVKQMLSHNVSNPLGKLQRQYKVLVYTQSASLKIHIFHNCGTLVKPKNLTRMDYY